MSLSRRTRNAPWLRVRKPGNSRDRYMPIIELDADEADRLGAVALRAVLDGQAHEAHELARDRDQRVHGGAVALAPELDADRDAAIGDEREGVRGIDGDRRQDRQVLGDELPVEPLALGGLSSLGSTMWMSASAISALRAIQQAC